MDEIVQSEDAGVEEGHLTDPVRAERFLRETGVALIVRTWARSIARRPPLPDIIWRSGGSDPRPHRFNPGAARFFQPCGRRLAAPGWRRYR